MENVFNNSSSLTLYVHSLVIFSKSCVGGFGNGNPAIYAYFLTFQKLKSRIYRANPRSVQATPQIWQSTGRTHLCLISIHFSFQDATTKTVMMCLWTACNGPYGWEPSEKGSSVFSERESTLYVIFYGASFKLTQYDMINRLQMLAFLLLADLGMFLTEFLALTLPFPMLGSIEQIDNHWNVLLIIALRLHDYLALWITLYIGRVMWRVCGKIMVISFTVLGRS